MTKNTLKPGCTSQSIVDHVAMCSAPTCVRACDVTNNYFIMLNKYRFYFLIHVFYNT